MFYSKGLSFSSDLRDKYFSVRITRTTSNIFNVLQAKKPDNFSVQTIILVVYYTFTVFPFISFEKKSPVSG